VWIIEYGHMRLLTPFHILDLHQGLAILQKYGPVEKIFIERGIWGNGEISKILFALRIHRVE